MDVKMLTAERFIDKSTGCGYRYVESATEYFRPHYHDYYEIFVVLEGEAVHQVNGYETVIKYGDTVFIRPRDIHDYIRPDGSEFYMLNISFTAETVNELFSYLGEGFPSKALLEATYPPCVVLSSNDIEKINLQLQKVCTYGIDNHEKIKTELRILLFKLFYRHFSNFKTESKDTPPWFNELLEKLNEGDNFVDGSEFIYSHCDKTREHISRCFKKYTGLTVSEYINRLRLNYIANMLRNSDNNISDIIFDSGFGNISWASAQFKEKYGMTMKEFRKQNS
ncbi:MAG: helix-turn-helix domain-containing protein [Clostridia bacterium]|nr:helix-turn-helix domain-containing protein [Clostridia bacterium]